MQCPVCVVDLMMSERQGVEVDYCPKCRGVWLDRGELDKIVEKSAAGAVSHAPHHTPAAAPHHEQQRAESHGNEHHQQKPHKKKESFLMDLFDF